jgi:hypothetical protein
VVKCLQEVRCPIKNLAMQDLRKILKAKGVVNFNVYAQPQVTGIFISCRSADANKCPTTLMGFKIKRLTTARS